MTLQVGVLREAFRNLQAFRSLYEAEGVDTLEAPTGESINLFDLEYLYQQLWRLPPQQHRAIELCLVQNIIEREAAVMMGVSHTNPVSSYATFGLHKLVDMVNSGILERFHAPGRIYDENFEDFDMRDVG